MREEENRLLAFTVSAFRASPGPAAQRVPALHYAHSLSVVYADSIVNLHTCTVQSAASRLAASNHLCFVCKMQFMCKMQHVP